MTEENENVSRDCLFLSSNLSTIASDMLCHISRILNGFCCIIEDINPLSQVPKAPLVTLPSPSSLSPIRRKTKSTDSSVLGDKDEKVDKEELGRKWNKPTQLLSQQNLGHFASNPLYVKLYELLKATYSTCKVIFYCITIFVEYLKFCNTVRSSHSTPSLQIAYQTSSRAYSIPLAFY